MQFYLVGGFVRSLFTGERTKDVDICVTGTTYEALLEFLLDNDAQVILPAPEYHHLFFCNSAYQMPDDSNMTSWNMGRITAKVGKNVVPVSVVNTSDITIIEDLSRRDFTMNAMAIPIYFENIMYLGSMSLDTLKFHTIDPYNGRQHIE